MIRLPCSSCGTIDFPKHYRERIRNGKLVRSRSSVCIICMREKARMRYERIRLTKVYEKILECNRNWRKRNLSKSQQSSREWAKRNADSIRQRKHEYYLKNKDEILKRNALWKSKNRIPKKADPDNSKHIWRVFNTKIKRSLNVL